MRPVVGGACLPDSNDWLWKEWSMQISLDIMCMECKLWMRSSALEEGEKEQLHTCPKCGHEVKLCVEIDLEA